MSSGQVRLDPADAADLRGLAARDGTPEIREVRTGLSDRY
jgi:hypothetical protein